MARSTDKLQFRLKGLLIFVALVSLPLALISYVARRQAIRRTELERLKELDAVTLHNLVKEVEAIRTQIGRAPRDTDELESLLGKPMPAVHDNGRPTSTRYIRTSENSFILQYGLWATDDWIYDSSKPQLGWVQHWY
jgi:hypothetical protein